MRARCRGAMPALDAPAPRGKSGNRASCEVARTQRPIGSLDALVGARNRPWRRRPGGGAQGGGAMTEQLELLGKVETYVGALFVAFYGFERFRKPPAESRAPPGALPPRPRHTPRGPSHAP